MSPLNVAFNGVLDVPRIGDDEMGTVEAPAQLLSVVAWMKQKLTAVDPPPGLTDPLRVAPVGPSTVGANVVDIGNATCVVKEIAGVPSAVPAEFVAISST